MKLLEKARSELPAKPTKAAAAAASKGKAKVVKPAAAEVVKDDYDDEPAEKPSTTAKGMSEVLLHTL